VSTARDLCAAALAPAAARARCGVVASLATLLADFATNGACAAPLPPGDVEVRAFVNDQCVLADEPFFQPQAEGAQSARSIALVGLIVGKLAGVLMDRAVTATAGKLSADAARKDTRYAVAKQTNLYRVNFEPAPQVALNGHLGCMTIVAGKFRDDAVDCRSEYLPKEISKETAALPESEWRTTRTDDSLENPLRRANICLEGAARAVYEARFEFSEDGTAWRLTDAGHRVDSLLGTSRAKAQRSVFYTLDIHQPGPTDKAETLATAWVNVGRVAAGDRSAGNGAAAPWLRVPPLSAEARRAYEEHTRVQQESAAEIGALKRAIVRNHRTREGLQQRAHGAAPAIAKALRAEIVKSEVQGIALEAELDARTREYADLPREPFELMPVSIEIGVTETESEKGALLALAKVIDANRGTIASAATSGLMGLAARSIDEPVKVGAPPPQTPVAVAGAELARRRDEYFDALVAARAERAAAAQGAGADLPVAATTPAADSDSARSLARAKAAYEAAQRRIGMETGK
jgi:hypothetical protein